MDRTVLRKVQMAQLEIAMEFKRVCDENGIRYFLDSGTLLGAVRHQGFIPWDDDMDFGMLAEDYERFLRIAPQKLKPEFFLQTWDSDEGYPFAFAKILKLGTEYVEDVFEHSSKRNELWVDIFPYYPFPEDIRLQRKQKFRIQVYKHILMVQSGMTPWTRPDSIKGKAKVWLMYLPSILGAKVIPRDMAKQRYEKALKMSIGKQSNAFYIAGTEKYGEWVIPADGFVADEELMFESVSFRAPKNYKAYLTSVYGDYMQLPPEDQRENRHRIVRIKL